MGRCKALCAFTLSWHELLADAGTTAGAFWLCPTQLVLELAEGTDDEASETEL